MNIIKLKRDHVLSLQSLFGAPKYMGVSLEDHYMAGINNTKIQNQLLMNRFADTYMSGLNSFHAYGAYAEDDKKLDKLLGFIAFYEDIQEASWWLTMGRNNGDKEVMRALLDKAIEHNEDNGRLKFYTLMNVRHAKIMRKFSWSEFNTERYDYVDEYVVPAKTRCIHHNAWEILFKRTLLPVDTLVRCSFLKQKYRDQPVIGGGVVNAEEQFTSD